MLHTTSLTRSRYFLLPITIISFFTLVLAAGAQEDLGPTDSGFVTGIEGEPETLLCSKYYSFGLIEVEVVASPDFVSGGDEVVFSGTLKNSNPEPIVNGQLYMKVFRKTNADYDEVVRNGYPMVAFTSLVDNIAISTDGTIPFEATWEVPPLADGGEYEARFYVTENNETNLLGIPASDHVFGEGVTFWVGGETEDTNVYFDKGSITINDEPIELGGLIQRFQENELITLRATVVNPSDEPAFAELWWWVSDWDSLTTDESATRDLQGIEVGPNSSREVTHIVPADAGPDIVVQGILNQHDSRSVLHVRMVKDGEDTRNIGFSGVSPITTESGKNSTAFVCIQDFGNGSEGNLDVAITATDDSGAELFTQTVPATTDTNPTLVEVPFELAQDVPLFTLHTQLLRDGEVIDEARKTYDCKALGESICREKKATTQEQNTVLMVVLMLLALTVLLAVLVYMRKSKESLQEMHYPEN